MFCFSDVWMDKYSKSLTMDFSFMKLIFWYGFWDIQDDIIDYMIFWVQWTSIFTWEMPWESMDFGPKYRL